MRMRWFLSVATFAALAGAFLATCSGGDPSTGSASSPQAGSGQADDDTGELPEVDDDTTAGDDSDDTETADDTAADPADGGADDTGDDDTGGPSILDTDYGDCKDGSGVEKADWPESLDFSCDAGVLTVTHVNGFFNCCLDDIEVALEITGSTITLREQEVASAPCWCVCPFDVETQIEGLAAGHYTVRVFVNGTLSITGETDVP